MKRTWVSMLLVLTSLISACSSGGTFGQSNTIAEADLSVREKDIILTTSERSFVYDFTLGSEYKEAAIWVEKYEFGELADPSASRMSTQVDRSGYVIFSVSDTYVNSREKAIKMGVFGESGGGAGTSIDTVAGEEWETEMSTWESLVTDEIYFTEDEIILASLSISMNGDNMQSYLQNSMKILRGI